MADLLEETVDFCGEVFGLGFAAAPAVACEELLTVLDEEIVALQLDVGHDFPFHGLLDHAIALST